MKDKIALELADDVISGKFELVCPEMELLVGTTEGRSLLRGSGVLRSDDEGILYFKMAGRRDAAFYDWIRRPRAPGQLMGEEDYLNLTATDERGGRWHSSPIVFEAQPIALLIPGSVSAPVATMTCTGRRPLTLSQLQMFISDAVHVPMDGDTESRRTVRGRLISSGVSRDHHSRELDGAHVEFRSYRDQWLKVEAHRKEAFPPEWPVLMSNALAFAIGHDVSPTVVIRSSCEQEEIRLQSASLDSRARHLPRPVHVINPAEAERFWKLIERFFDFIKDRSTARDLVLSELAGIRRGAAGSIQTAALILSVATESLAEALLVDEQVAVPDQDRFRSLLDHLEAWDGDARLRERAKGAIGGLKQARAADRLYAWANRTGTPRVLIDRWRTLRNPKAHGKAIPEEQPLFDLYYSNVELMYRLVTWACGYDGPVTPTSEPGWQPRSQDGRSADGRQ